MKFMTKLLSIFPFLRAREDAKQEIEDDKPARVRPKGWLTRKRAVRLAQKKARRQNRGK